MFHGKKTQSQNFRSQPCGVLGTVQSHRCHRDAAGHLHRGKQGIHAVHGTALHGNADHRQGGVGSKGTRQMCCHACCAQDHAEAVGTGAFGKLRCPGRGAVCRKDVRDLRQRRGGTGSFEALLGDGSQYGIHLQYKVQPSPDGLAQAFILGEEFIGDDCCAMILGDNIFYGNGFSKILKTAAANAENKGRCTVFGYYVQDPERFGIVEFDKDGKVLSVEEKPQHPKSNYAITGLYFYNKEVVKMAKQVKPSARGELEITTLNDMYLKKDELDVQLLGRGFAWLDTGTMDSLVEAADFVRMIEKRQGIKISAPEEIAFKYGWIDRDTLLESAERYGKSPYGQHLKNVADGKLRY